MMYKKIKKRKLFAITIMIAAVTGCSNEAITAANEALADGAVYFSDNKKTESKKNSENPELIMIRISEICRDIFEEAADTNTTDSLETARKLVERIGGIGYPVVDRKNQINMVNAGPVIRFCEQTEPGNQAELTIITVEYTGGLTKYDLRAEDGSLHIDKSYYQYENGNLQNKSTYSYPADSWQYTEDGYFLFSGSYYSQDYYIYALSDVTVCTALRVQPLDEKCREWNRQYILPVGYGRNNLFLIDWDESDFGNLDFYDVFDKFYPLVNGIQLPYKPDENLGVGAVCRIPETEFENVLLSYFQISQEILRSKTTFFPEDSAYEYKPRGLHETESEDIPYPEVAAYKENNDGTITLTVNAVYPRKNTSKAFSHEVVVRPLSDGGFQYVSNQIIPSPDNVEPTWRRERLTEERWEEVYGDN